MLEKITNISIKGIACALPNNKVTYQEYYSKFGELEVNKIVKMTGVKTRYITNEKQYTSDLCYVAARDLMESLGWEPETVSGIIFVTQTPDYILPATACMLQAKLGLSTNTFALDINMGCSGYVYGLWTVSKFISPTNKRILLLAGDTISKTIAKEDRSTTLLFGDGGSATAVEYTEGKEGLGFDLYTDGNGYRNIIIPKGITSKFETGIETENPEALYMNGTEVFNFSISEVPDSIKKFIHDANSNFYYFIPHQANLFMLKHLAKKVKIPLDKVLFSIEDFGNTSSASIPVTIVHNRSKIMEHGEVDLLLAGFGVGWSWALAEVRLSGCNVLPMIFTDEVKEF